MKYIKFTAGILVGFLSAVVLFTAIFFFYPNDTSPSVARLDFALKQLDIDQKRLGIQCVDGDKYILNYIDAVTPVVERMADGQRLLVSDPIHALGDRASDVMTTCAFLKNITEAGHSQILSKLALGDDAVRQEVTVIRLALSRSTVSWCGVDCVQDARNEILRNASLVRPRLTSTK